MENRRAFLRFLTRRLASVDAAEDVLQEFYAKALSKAGQIRGSESIVAWLARLLRTTLADHYRARERRMRHEGHFAREAARFVNPTEKEVNSFACECLHGLLPTLRTDYAEILRRIDLAGEDRGEIGASLGLTMNNLTVRLHRARQALRAALMQSCKTCPVHGFLQCGCDLPIRKLATSAAM